MSRMHIGISIWLLVLGCETICMQRNQNSCRSSTEQGKASPAVSKLWHKEQLQHGWGSPERSSLATLVFSRVVDTARKAPGAYLNLQKPLHWINICTDLFTQLYFHFILLQQFTSTLDMAPSAQKSPWKQMKDLTWCIFHVWEAESMKGNKHLNSSKILFSKWAFCCHCKNEI